MHNIIQRLEKDNSRLAKEAIILKEAKAGNSELFEGFRLCYDPLVTFGVAKVPKHAGPDGQGLSWEVFLDLARMLRDRDLTGHDARDAIELALTVATQDQWNGWYRRILVKDMRAGVSEKTINKMVKKAGRDEYTIPLFEVMLAHDGANHESKITGRKLLEPKLDGVRVITVINAANKTVTQYSRNGRILENFSHITDGLLKNIEDWERSMVLDGEMVSSSFQKLMTQVHRKEDVQASDARLMLFDILPLSEFLKGKSSLGQKRRSAMLRGFKPIIDKASYIDIIEQTEVDLDEYVGELQLKQFNEEALAAGYEGILIKDVDAPYVCKRSVHWLKRKPVLSFDLAIVQVEEGTGKYEGMAGAVVCKGVDGGRKIVTNVGSGITDDQRKEIWESKDAMIGQVVEVFADVITKSQDSDDEWSLRFPRLGKFRGFKTGEKL